MADALQLTNVTMYTGIVTEHKVCRQLQLLKVYQFTEINSSGVNLCAGRVWVVLRNGHTHSLKPCRGQGSCSSSSAVSQGSRLTYGHPWITVFSQLAGDSIEKLPVEELPRVKT